MSAKTDIAWTDSSWNPVSGCTHAGSPGCDHCYARAIAMRFQGDFIVRCHKDRLEIPLHWKKPRRIFLCSTGDLFHEAVSFEFIHQVMLRIRDCEHHTFQILTKRPERMVDFFKWAQSWRSIYYGAGWTNLWLGTTVETQAQDWRINELLKCPAARYFISHEPAIGPLVLPPEFLALDKRAWVIIGAESGPGRRPFSIPDAKALVAQCREAGVKVFVKQINIVGKVSRDMSQWPEDLRVREFPV